MSLAVKPRNPVTPYILDVYDDSLPAGAPRLVARCDTRTGDIWRTKGAPAKVKMIEILCALEESEHVPSAY